MSLEYTKIQKGERWK